MNNFGHVIKLERIRRNMKQISLAQGICTPSYLSKIEKNSIVPSQEVVDLLLQRLELSITQNKVLDDEAYLSQIREIYFNAVMNKDRELVAKQLQEINNERYMFSDSTNYYTFQLMVLRLTLIAQDVRNDTSELIMALSELSGNFNNYQMFMFNCSLGNYYYFKHDYAFSLKAFEKALIIQQKADLQDWEIADFHYMLGMIYLNQQRLVICIDFLGEALNYFKDNFYYTRAIECYLVLSIAQKKSHKLEEAQETLELAKRIAIQLNLEEYFSIIFHNLGTIMAQRGDWEKAIEYYIEGMTLSDDVDVKLMGIISIVHEYSRHNQSEMVIQWANKGIELYNEDKSEELLLYYHHLKIYLAKFNNYDDFEQVVVKAIHYFKETHDYISIYKYYTFLAEYFFANNKYKKSANYFMLANEYLFLKNKFSSWEDL